MRNKNKQQRGIRGATPRVVFFTLLIAFLATCSLSAAKMYAKVVSTWGSAKVLRGGKSAWLPVKQGMYIFQKDKVRTALGSGVKLSLPNGSYMKIKENTLFSMQQLASSGGKQQITGNVAFGSVSAKVKRAKGSTVKVKTPSVIAAVKGTTFSVEVENGLGKIISDKNNSKGSLVVYVPGKENESKELSPGKAIIGRSDGKLSGEIDISEGDTKELEVLETEEKSLQKETPPKLNIVAPGKGVHLGRQNPVIQVGGTTDPYMTVVAVVDGQNVGRFMSGRGGKFKGKADLSAFLDRDVIEVVFFAENLVGRVEEKRSVRVHHEDTTIAIGMTNEDGRPPHGGPGMTNRPPFGTNGGPGPGGHRPPMGTNEDGRPPMPGTNMAGTNMPPMPGTNMPPMQRGPFELMGPMPGSVIKDKNVIFRGKGVPGGEVTIAGKTFTIPANGVIGPHTVFIDMEGPVKVDVIYVAPDGSEKRMSFGFRIDTTPPKVEDFVVEGLVDGVATKASVMVKMRVSPDTAEVRVNGIPLQRAGEGRFQGMLSAFRDGPLNVTVSLVDFAGHVTKINRTVNFDMNPPYLMIREPLALPRVVGVTEDGAYVTVEINGQKVVDASRVRGSFIFDLSQALLSFQEEQLKIKVYATDAFGRMSPVFGKSLYYDIREPKVDIPDYFIQGRYVTFKGTIGEPGTVTLHLAEKITRQTDSSGAYEIRVELKKVGRASFVIEAVDEAGNRMTKTIRLHLPPFPPEATQ